MSAGIDYEVCDATKLDDPLLRRMWRLRLQFMDLKPGVVEEDDFRSFARFFREGKYGVLFRESSGRLVGFFGVELSLRTAQGQRYLAMVMEYAFMEEAYQGHPAMLWARIDVSLRVLLHNPWIPKYAFGLTYPATAVTLHNAYPGVVALGEPGLTDFQREALLDHARRAGGGRFHPSSHLVPMNTIPKTKARIPRSKAHREAYASFVRLNPQWQQGYCLVMMAPFRAPTVLDPLRRMVAKRWGRGAGAR